MVQTRYWAVWFRSGPVPVQSEKIGPFDNTIDHFKKNENFFSEVNLPSVNGLFLPQGIFFVIGNYVVFSFCFFLERESKLAVCASTHQNIFARFARNLNFSKVILCAQSFFARCPHKFKNPCSPLAPHEKKSNSIFLTYLETNFLFFSNFVPKTDIFNSTKNKFEKNNNWKCVTSRNLGTQIFLLSSYLKDTIKCENPFIILEGFYSGDLFTFFVKKLFCSC